MATMELAYDSLGRERGPPTHHSTRIPVDNNGGSARDLDENRNSPSVSKGLGGMLKTTTETGEIGLFSIKQSRVPLPVNKPRRASGPHNDGGMRKPRQFQPYGVPNTDDRRRLPSYARDASSEVLSMFETASQKSGSRVFDDPDNRSHSMTQTYSSYSLSNHRSYASLRSQPDIGSIMQRPRSPFAYPARLKRPGFRPSSPALTDGGAIDYSRRAEIDRTPYSTNHYSSSPASLYAQRRRPQLSLRPEATRSTPSLLSHSSPQRRSPSPKKRQHSGTLSNDWQRRNGSASISTSPARSTLSLASTVHIYQTAHAPSVTTTLGNIPPLSPLYYDYTEDFDVDDYDQTRPLEPPPQFCTEETIPEERSLISGWMSLDGSRVPTQEPKLNSTHKSSTSDGAAPQNSRESFRDSVMNKRQTSGFEVYPKDANLEPVAVGSESAETYIVPVADRKMIRLSGLGLGARELSTHVEEVFGLSPTASFEVLISDVDVDDDMPKDKTIIHDELAEAQSIRSSSHSLGTHLSRFPPPPKDLDGQFSENVADQTLALVSSTPPEVSHNPLHMQIEEKESASATEHKIVTNVVSPSTQCLFPLQSDRKRLSRPYSIDNGLTELDQLVNAFEEANRTRKEKALMQNPVKDLPQLPRKATDGSLSGNKPSSQRFNPLCSSDGLRNDNGNGEIRDQGLKGSHQRHRPRRLEAVTVPTISESDVPAFSHQFPRKLMSRSESQPMLAPKPISPARQLKLKNSVPHLMKALPALPPELPICVVSSPLHLKLSAVELPCQFSPLLPDSKHARTQEAQVEKHSLRSDENGAKKLADIPQQPVELDSVAVTALIPEWARIGQASPAPSPKLKLKMKSSITLRPTSPPESRPWNSEGSYTWSSQPFNVGLPKVAQEVKPAHPNPPRFKLRIIRASNSTIGTVRINREAADLRNSAGLHLRHPKDLFTPNSGIENIFRQVSKHLHSRKSSGSSSHQGSGQRSTPILAPVTDQTFLARSLSSRHSTQPSQTSLSVASRTEVRSFFSDDSSHRRVGGRRLGTRISNLRARIVGPYGAANGTKSHDDITWRTRSRQDALLPAALLSIPDLIEERAGGETKTPRRLSEKIHAQKLRTRFIMWFKGAKSAIRARVNSRRTAERNDDEPVQLTA